MTDSFAIKPISEFQKKGILQWYGEKLKEAWTHDWIFSGWEKWIVAGSCFWIVFSIIMFIIKVIMGKL